MPKITKGILVITRNKTQMASANEFIVKFAVIISPGTFLLFRSKNSLRKDVFFPLNRNTIKTLQVKVFLMEFSDF